MIYLSRRSFVFFGLLMTMGCTRAPEPPFSIAEVVSELPELHQANLAEGLRSMFGTPSRPRIAIRRETAESESAPDDEFQMELVDVARLPRGAQVYQQRCSGCHGISGDGMGAAAPYLRPKPRDYRKAIYKFTSTPYGDRPARQDFVRTIRRGAKGTSMPAFPWLSNEDLEAVVDYVIYLSLRGRVEESVALAADDYDEDEPLDSVEFVDALESELRRWDVASARVVRAASAEPAFDENSVKLGRTLFINSSCYQCHGVDAKGQTEWLSEEFIAAQQSAPPEKRILINYDAWGDPAPAADITARLLHGGRRPIDIYRRIYTGINGTPMPAFGRIFAKDPDAIWHMVHYVLHIVDGGDPTLGIGLDDVKATAAADGGEEA
jgi:mono/diheme cytochrome c family protein